MKALRFAFALAISLALLLSGTALAQEADPAGPAAPEVPDAITTASFEPTSGYPGNTTTLTINFNIPDPYATPYSAFCIYYQFQGEIWGFQSGPTSTIGGDVYTLYADGSAQNTAVCSDSLNRDDVLYLVNPVNEFADGGDILPVQITVPATVAAGSHAFIVRQRLSADGTTWTIGGTQNLIYTVLPFPSTVYVGNTDCGGNTPCFTGTTGLQSAINALPASGGTINVYGAYNANANTSIGTKNITLQPVDASSSLNYTSGAGLRIDGTGNLTVIGLMLDGHGTAVNGIVSVNTQIGRLTVQNNARIQNFVTNGVTLFGAGPHTIENTTFSGNGTGLRTSNAAVATVRSSTFSGNNGYALYQNIGTSLTAYANNITGNNGGGFQAYVSTTTAAAKNWWGSHNTATVGPTSDGSVSYADGWARRLGADVTSVSWGLSNGTATLGSATLSGGTGTPVIISFGSGSLNAPFGNGIPPYVNRVCSDFYDFYVVNGSGNWTIGLPIDNTPECTANVLNREVVYKIDPTVYDTACNTADNAGCWSLIPESSIVADVDNRLLLVTQTAAELGYTNITAGDETGADPTVIQLSNLTATSARNTWLPLGLLAFSLVLGGIGFFVTRRKLQA